MDVSIEQCSGHSLIHLFWCPICNKLVRHMKFHDGGFNQPFCKRPFCGVCIEEKIQPEKSFSGPLLIKRVSCPVRDCGMPLQSNMIRGSTKMEDIWYNTININCINCLQNFNPDDYAKHVFRCPGNKFEPFIVGEPLKGDLMFSVNSNSKRKLFISDDASPSDVGLVTYERQLEAKTGIIFELRFAGTATKVKIRPDVDMKELMETLRKAYNFAGEMDLAYVAHRSLVKSGSVADFLSVLPVGAPINFVPIPEMVDLKSKEIELYLTQGIPRNSCLYGQEIPEDLPN
uniref:Uncharacterized protein n=1 Tax=Tetranychus urticae TaxID=32264 RepID=T1JR47_TETUR